MKRLMIVCTIVCLVVLLPISLVSAQEGMPVFGGLYLIDGQVKLDNVNFDVSIDEVNSCKVTATYEMTNDTDETQFLTLGTPITDSKVKDYRYSFTPYQYSTVVVSGSKVNKEIMQVDVDYDKWRNYSIPMTLSKGESATATVVLVIEPKREFPGKTTFDIDMDHLKSWAKDYPKKVNIEASFNPQTVKIYNFDNEFSIRPSEISSEYKYIWNLSEADVGDISFNYYFVDEEIIRQLKGIKSSKVNSMVNSYKKGDYRKVIDYGREYVSKTDNRQNQNKVYLMMTDAYVSLKEYEEALVLCDLIETGAGDFGSIDEKVKERILYNKIQSYSGLKEYEEMYDLIEYELNYSNRNTYMVQWMETKIDLIPSDDLEKIKESRREPSKLEIMINKLFYGEFYFYLIAIVVLILIIAIIFFIRRKRKKDRFFY